MTAGAPGHHFAQVELGEHAPVVGVLGEIGEGVGLIAGDEVGIPGGGANVLMGDAQGVDVGVNTAITAIVARRAWGSVRQRVRPAPSTVRTASGTVIPSKACRGVALSAVADSR